MNQTDSKWNANLYNQKHAFVYDYGTSLIELLTPKSDEKIMDLGCGTGQLTAKIAEQATYVLGIDASVDMIDSARKEYSNIDFQVGDAADFTSEIKFDAIFSNAALHWVLQYEQAAQSMFDNLKDGGRLVLEMGGQGNVNSLVETLKRVLRRRGFKKQADIMQWYSPSIGEYTTVLERAGFKIDSAQLYDRPTKLAEEDSAIKDWLTMFCQSYFQGIETEIASEIMDEVQNNLKAKIFRDGAWFADYRRLRVIAHR